MIAAAPVLTNIFLSVAAIAGLLVLTAVVRSRGPWDPINRRFLFALRTTTALFACRLLASLTGVELFRALVLVSASLIPLAVLILTEGLLRRHAPAWIKGLVGIGSVIFVILALWPGASEDTTRRYALLSFQIAGLMASGWLVLTRDKASLSVAENRAVGRLGLSLILLIPLGAADFLTNLLGLPIQVAGLGVLFLCWLAISLGRQEAQHGGALWGFAVVVGAAATATALLAIITGMDRDADIMTGAVVMAALLVASIVNDARALRTEEQSLSLLRHLATADSDVAAFLRGLRAHPLVDGAAFIDATSLADLDRGVLGLIFAASPVLRRADPPFTTGAEGDHIAHLFSRFDATHILLIRPDPLWLLALSMPAIMASDRAELELQAVQRVAALLARGEHEPA